MAFKDLREYVSLLETKGELKRVKAEVDWDEEIGAIVRKTLMKQGPALLFENIKDHKDTFSTKFFANGLGSWSRCALALGLPADTSPRDLVRTMKERIAKPVKPKVVNKGPVKENILRNEEVDLYQIPVPKYHNLDGGRYINTLCGTVTGDRDTGFLNIGTYRGMITARDRIGVLLARSQHWGHHFTKYQERGEPMPVAVVYGWDPVLIMMAACPVIHWGGVSEYDLMGALRREPVELVKCETSELLVPAAAEIVVEGTISPDPKTFEMEGPFGEYPGYYGGMKSPKPVIKVDCITHRNDPIFRGGVEGSSPGRLAETTYSQVPAFCAAVWQLLEMVGVPGVLDVWAPPVATTANMRVKIRKQYRGHAKQIANAIWGSGAANHAAKHLTVVDEDIDIHDDGAMEWAIAYRVNAAMDDVLFFPGTFGSPLDPSIPLRERDLLKYGQGKWCRVLVDATMNWDLEKEEQYGGNRYPPVCTKIDPKIEQLVDKRWKEYGLE